jgi:ABC-type Na+ efflux pump permease subunit
MTRQTTAERAAVLIGRVVGLLAVAFTALGAWVLLGQPTSLGTNGYLTGSVVSILLLVGVAYALSERHPRLGGRRRSA